MGLFFSLRRRVADFSGTRHFVRRFGAARARQRAARWGRALGGMAVDAGGCRSAIAAISAGAMAASCKVCAQGCKCCLRAPRWYIVGVARRKLAWAVLADGGPSVQFACAAYAVLTHVALAGDRVQKSARCIR